MSKIVYLAHPLGAHPIDRPENIKRAVRWYRYFLVHYDVAIIADALGMRAGQLLLAYADEIWLCGGRLSEGMIAEVSLAEQLEIRVLSYLHHGVEPPEDDRILVPQPYRRA